MEKNRPVLFLDLDGVIVDFISGVIDWYGLDAKHDDVTGWNMIVEMSGMSVPEFWEGLDTYRFWRNLRMYDYAQDILELIDEAHVQPCLLTSPAWHTAGYKQDWIQKNLPDYFNKGRYLIGPAKGFCSYPNPNGSYLMDDSDKNCDLFNLFGGQAIVFPQPWNALRDIDVDKVEYVGMQLMAKGLRI